jgi:hypothetical protein
MTDILQTQTLTRPAPDHPDPTWTAPVFLALVIRIEG